jgi:hypothetical protein
MATVKITLKFEVFVNVSDDLAGSPDYLADGAVAAIVDGLPPGGSTKTAMFNALHSYDDIDFSWQDG